MTQLPDYLRNSNLPDFTDRLGANLGTQAQPYLSIEGDRLTLVDADGATQPVLTRDEKTGDPYLDCCIIDAGDHESKIYFGRAYDPKAETFSPPKCWSDNGIAPSINASEPQARSCAADPDGKWGCKWAVWGSGRAREGSSVVPPACGKYQKLALLIPGDDIQFLLRVPPGSLEQLRAYNNKFKGTGITIRDVMTRISIRDKTLFFRGLDFISAETAAARDACIREKRTDALVGRGDRPRQGALPAPEKEATPIKQLERPPVEEHRPLPVAELTSASTGAPAVPTATVTTPSRRRGRPAKPAEPTQTEPVAPFRQEANGSADPKFGMAPGVAPNADLEAALRKSIFG